MEKSGRGENTFVGLSDPLAVADLLETRYRWFAYAWADAEAAQLYAPVHVPRPADPLSDPTWASYVSAQYLAHPLIQAPPQTALDTGFDVEFIYSDSQPSTVAAPGTALSGGVQASNGTPGTFAVVPAFGSPAGGTLVTIVGLGLRDLGDLWRYVKSAHPRRYRYGTTRRNATGYRQGRCNHNRRGVAPWWGTGILVHIFASTVGRWRVSEHWAVIGRNYSDDRRYRAGARALSAVW